MVHLNGFDDRLACIHLCCFKFHFVVSVLLQMVHSYVVRDVLCCSICILRLDLMYFFLQYGHSTESRLNRWKRSVCDSRMCRTRLFLCMNRSRQYGQHFGLTSCVSRCQAIFACEWNTSPQEQMKSLACGRNFKWCRLRCCIKFENRLNRFMHRLHFNGASLLWIRMCSIMLWRSTNRFGQWMQRCSRMFKCRFKWMLKLTQRLNVRPHV